jgi:8-oxo-dGTP pyrophosphatase MutT (NUDIX family)
MSGISIIALELPDGQFVVQRRGEDAAVSPGLLGFFGGHIENGEKPEEAAARELREETSLDFAELQFIGKYIIDKETLNRLRSVSFARDDFKFNLFLLKIEKPNFAVYEGKGLEIYTLEELRKRKDTTASLEYAVINLLGGK